MQTGRPSVDSAVLAERIATTPAARELVPSDPQLSARWHRHGVPSAYARWNYHPEYEVHLIRSGTGRYLVGDSIDTFGPGHLTLIGSNVPHHWISDLEPGESIPDRDVVFQFHPRWIEEAQILLPELAELEPLLLRSRRGIEFTGRTARRGADELLAIGSSRGPERLQHIFGLFDVLGSAPESEHRLISVSDLPLAEDSRAAEVVDRVLAYILENLVGEVRLSVAARTTGMSDSAFSRYFKRASGQTFTETVRKLRLAHACRLLRQTSLPVASVYQRVGYTNLSNFNRQFRAQYAVTPSTYRRQHQERRGRPADELVGTVPGPGAAAEMYQRGARDVLAGQRQGR